MAQSESYQGLARKWRPQRFEDLVGQEAVAASLQNALRQDRLAHAHILTGPRGVGKTTSARILAKALNCEQGPTPTPCGKCRHCIDITQGNDLDVIEIDAASNTGVDNIRELRERVIHAPFAARYKVYIIDEVHMLSTGAFNALLKTLEEPPPNVVFIFATTEIEKVPETIRSRCVVHNFRRMGAEDIARRLAQVARAEGIETDEASAAEIYGLIARAVEGGMRDALVAFDQLLALTDGKPDVEAASKLLGLADQATLRQTVKWLNEGKAVELLGLIEDLVDRGRSLERFVKSLVAYLRDLMLLQAGVESRLLGVTGDALEESRGLAKALAPATLYNILNQIFELEERLKTSGQGRFLVEFTFLRLAAIKPVVPMDEILRRVAALPEGALQGSDKVSPGESEPTRQGVKRASGLHVAVLCDVASEAMPTAPDVTSLDTAGLGVLEGMAINEAMQAMVGALPETARFLARYLRDAAAISVVGNQVTIRWPQGKALSKGIAERGENRRLIEEALTRLCGREMRYTGETGGDAGAAKPERFEPVHAHLDVPEITTEEIPQAYSTAVIFGDSHPPSIHADDARNAIEKARPLLSGDGEAARRVRMLRDMFSGTPIDGSGQAVSV